MMHLSHDFRISDEYRRLATAFASVEGFLDPLEGYALYRCAAEGPGIGAVVELGSYCGRSTAFLAAGSKAACREKVVAVDHFLGSPEHQPGKHFASPVLAREGTTFQCFRANLERVHLLDHVEAINAPSAEAVLRWTAPIRLLFIDAEHSYESVRHDFDGWTPFVVPGGLVLLHDVGDEPGVTRVFQEVIAEGKSFKLIVGVVSLRVLQKT
jgi:predicted O-methyltransferase YrrM